MPPSFLSRYTRYNPPLVYANEVLVGEDRQRLDEYDAVMEALELLEPGTHKIIKEYYLRMQLIKKIDEVIEMFNACEE